MSDNTTKVLIAGDQTVTVRDDTVAVQHDDGLAVTLFDITPPQRAQVDAELAPWFSASRPAATP